MKVVTFTATSRREFRKLSPSVQTQLTGKLARYAETGAGDVTQLIGRDAARLRSGDYRVIFLETQSTLDVVAIGHRREIYR